MLKHHFHTGTQSFLELMFDYNILPCVTRPTHITSSTATLLDNLLVSMNLYTKQKTNVLLYDLSDHLLCFLIMKNYFKNTKEKLFSCKHALSEKNIKKLSDTLSQINWVDHLYNKNAEESMNTFHRIIMENLDAITPERLVPISTNCAIKECWMTPGLLKCSRKQLYLHKKFIAMHTEANFLKYKMYKTVYQKVKRSCHKEFYLKKCVEFKNHSRKLWQMINTVTGKCKDKRTSISKITVNQIEISSSTSIGNHLAGYFANIGKNYANKISSSNISIDEYIAKIRQHQSSLFLSPTDKHELKTLIGDLSSKSSSGWDGMSNILIKQLRDQIVDPLVDIFNKSITEGLFPTIKKLVCVSPLHKAGCTDLDTNYRPISLLPVISKVLERVIYKRTYSFLVNNSLLYTSQYGFRKYHLFEHAIQELVGTILKGNERNKHTAAIFLDLSKAFDTLNHEVLFHKLERYG